MPDSTGTGDVYCVPVFDDDEAPDFHVALADLSPFLTPVLDDRSTPSASVAELIAAGSQGLIFAAAHELFAHPDEQLSRLLPPLRRLGDTSLPQNDFQRRTANILARCELSSWADLCRVSPAQLLGLRNSGKTSVLDILAVAVEAAARAVVSDQGYQAILLAEAGLGDEDHEDSADSPVLPEDDEPATLHALGEVVHTVRLLASWHEREQGPGNLASLFAVQPDQSLPPDLTQTLSWSGNLDTATLCYPHLVRAEIEVLVDDLLACFTDDWRLVLSRRVLAATPDTLEQIGRDLGVTREAVRQTQRKAERQLAELLEDESLLPLHWRAAALREALGAAAPLTSGLTRDALQRATRDVDHEAAEPLLLRLAGPYRLRDGWWMRVDSALPDGRDLLAVMGTARLITTDDASSWLAARGVRADFLDEWVARDPQLKLRGDLVLNWSGSAVDKCITMLQVLGRPATAEALVEAVGEGHSSRSVRQRFFEDSRLMRVNRSDWVLREWGGEEYTGITDEIEQRIHEWGGRAQLSALVDELVEQFGVAAASVRAYAEAPMFVTEDGYVRLRASDDPLEARQTLPRSRGLYRRSTGSWAYVMSVDSEVLRGSGRLCPEVLARAARIEPGSDITFDGPAGALRISWPRTSAFGPSLGSTRALAVGVSAEEGDELRIQFDLASHTYRTYRIPAESWQQGDPRRVLELVTGLDLSDDQLLEGVAAGIGTTAAAVIGVLRHRGDDRLADLLPSTADHALNDALADLAALFDREDT